ncbi:hypothetical protein HK100_010194, partial [Physocladia obscura]
MSIDINRLPAEIKQEIIQYLPINKRLFEIGRVCRSFRDIINSAAFASSHLRHAEQRGEKICEKYSEIRKKLPVAYASAALAMDANFAIKFAAKMGHTEVAKLLLAHSRKNPVKNDGQSEMLQ